ncbi:DUF2845 domain-containing protein [Chryseobacterium paridis]|uniref:DUF2845 domain-containing protein n=1 Tax=Chryseobacterium paridis TaxID=2800328 RepID=A0ABS1FPW3_9FLAO|nr:DUF2845 domain-containing protein [Chryseobacterium paridis]MBK1894471.1 DUF2845 domain-containing protein [Chryseobacterium paridis]
MRLFLIQTISIVLILASLTSCTTRSKFSSESVSIGMTKEQVISKFGQPYKSAFTKNKDTGEMEESLFYKENFNLGNSSITNILTFKDGKLVALEQGQESNTNSPTIVTHP